MKYKGLSPSPLLPSPKIEYYYFIIFYKEIPHLYLKKLL